MKQRASTPSTDTRRLNSSLSLLSTFTMASQRPVASENS
jgi:hypothetical protein